MLGGLGEAWNQVCYFQRSEVEEKTGIFLQPKPCQNGGKHQR